MRSKTPEPAVLISGSSYTHTSVTHRRSKNKKSSLLSPVSPLEKLPPRPNNIQVCVRIRPLSRRERESGVASAWTWEEEGGHIKAMLTRTSSKRRNSEQHDGPCSTTSSDTKPMSSTYSETLEAHHSGVFNFDNVFSPSAQTINLYGRAVQAIVLATMSGFHGSVLAYGQTSTGKTYTMQGTNKQPGIIPLAVTECFECIGSASQSNREFLLRVSYLELYNENLNDLLAPAAGINRRLKGGNHSGGSPGVRILDDRKKGVVVCGAKEEVVSSPAEVFALISAGEAHRHVGVTEANIASSRSHTLFRLTIESRAKSKVGSMEVSGGRRSGGMIRGESSMAGRSNGHQPVRVSTLQLVDLAGSESVRLAGTTGDRLREGGFINRSLLTLGTVIRKLSDATRAEKENSETAVGKPQQRDGSRSIGVGKSSSSSSSSSSGSSSSSSSSFGNNGAKSARGTSSHVPYRDSKLTRLLQNSLGGNAQIALICTMTPAAPSFEESLSTLKFAARAKLVRQTASVNEVPDPASTMIKRYKDEIVRLKQQLAEARAASSAATTTPSTAFTSNLSSKSGEEAKKELVSVTRSSKATELLLQARELEVKKRERVAMQQEGEEHQQHEVGVHDSRIVDSQIGVHQQLRNGVTQRSANLKGSAHNISGDFDTADILIGTSQSRRLEQQYQQQEKKKKKKEEEEEEEEEEGESGSVATVADVEVNGDKETTKPLSESWHGGSISQGANVKEPGMEDELMDAIQQLENLILDETSGAVQAAAGMQSILQSKTTSKKNYVRRTDDFFNNRSSGRVTVLASVPAALSASDGKKSEERKARSSESSASFKDNGDPRDGTCSPSELQTFDGTSAKPATSQPDTKPLCPAKVTSPNAPLPGSRGGAFLLGYAMERPPDPGPLDAGLAEENEEREDTITPERPRALHDNSMSSVNGDNEDLQIHNERSALQCSLSVGEISPPPSGSRAPSSTPNHLSRNRTPHSAIVTSTPVGAGVQKLSRSGLLPRGSDANACGILADDNDFLCKPSDFDEYQMEQDAEQDQWHNAIAELNDPRQMSKPPHRPEHPDILALDLGFDESPSKVVGQQATHSPGKGTSLRPTRVSTEVKLLREQLSSAPSPAGSPLFWSQDLGSDDDGAIVIAHHSSERGDANSSGTNKVSLNEEVDAEERSSVHIRDGTHEIGGTSVSSVFAVDLANPSSRSSTDLLPLDNNTAIEATCALKHKRSKSVPPLLSSKAASWKAAYSNRRLTTFGASLTGRKEQESQQSLTKLQKERQDKLVAELDRIRSVLRRVVSKIDGRNSMSLHSLSSDIAATSKAKDKSDHSWPDVAVSKSKSSYGERGLSLFQRSNLQLEMEGIEKAAVLFLGDSNTSEASSSTDAANEGRIPCRTPPSSANTSTTSEGKHAAVLESLKAQLEEQMIANSFRIADGVYLEQQLVEKSRALDQCLAVVELCEKQQAKLADENQELAEEGTRLRRILQSRERELLEIKGIQNGDHETF